MAQMMNTLIVPLSGADHMTARHDSLYEAFLSKVSTKPNQSGFEVPKQQLRLFGLGLSQADNLDL